MPNVYKEQKTEDTLTATRALERGAPEVAPPWARELAVKKSEEIVKSNSTKL